MAKEIEHRYLHKYPGYVFDAVRKNIGQPIMQGYIYANKDKQIRVRIYPKTKDAHICFKRMITPSDRHEFVYPISYADAVEIFNSCENTLDKYRISYEHELYHEDIDIFSDGVVVVEIEDKGQGEFTIPEHCGEEITNNFRYTNYYYAGVKEPTDVADKI